MLLRDNIFGSIEEDAQRRDFTINSLYYGVADFTLRDYVGGLNDLKQGVIRLIGDPEPATAKIRCACCARCASPPSWICASAKRPPSRSAPASLLHEIPPARLFEESPQAAAGGLRFPDLPEAVRIPAVPTAVPLIARNFTPNHDTPMERILVQVLKNTDHRLQNDMRVNPAFLFATMLWYPLLEHAQKLAQESGRPTTTPSRWR